MGERSFNEREITTRQLGVGRIESVSNCELFFFSLTFLPWKMDNFREILILTLFTHHHLPQPSMNLSRRQQKLYALQLMMALCYLSFPINVYNFLPFVGA